VTSTLLENSVRIHSQRAPQAAYITRDKGWGSRGRPKWILQRPRLLKFISRPSFLSTESIFSKLIPNWLYGGILLLRNWKNGLERQRVKNYLKVLLGCCYRFGSFVILLWSEAMRRLFHSIKHNKREKWRMKFIDQTWKKTEPFWMIPLR
jgi:hypothetical protein